MPQKLQTYGESAVKRALIKYYSEKYKDFPESEKEDKIASALKKTIPSKGGDILAGPTNFGYVYGGSIPSNLKGVEEVIDKKSGFNLIYDSFAEGLEPVYFWILDYMRDAYWGTGLDVSKTLDEFQGSVGSGYFGDLGTRASIMQDRAMKMMTTINSVIRSVINILYDLKEFDQRLVHYKKLSSPNALERSDARLALKQIWMDRVDMQRGRGSINMLAQQLQFVTLRDAFMAASSEEAVQDMDLNDRVKRILAPRVQEYLAWEKLSGAELNRRFEIEKSYLRSQIESLKLYAQWAKPYLRTAQQLSSSNYRTPDLVTIFNNLQLQVSLFGKKEVKVIDLHEVKEIYSKNIYANLKLPKKIYACVEVTMDYRTIPHTVSRGESGLHYTQGGKVSARFRGFSLDEDEANAVEKEETWEGLEMIEGMTEATLKQIQDEVEKYLAKDEEELPQEKTKSKIKKESLLEPLKSVFSGLKEVVNPIKGLWKPDVERVISELRKKAAGNAAKSSYQIYLVYKKAHGMMSE